MSASSFSLTPYSFAETHRVLPLLRRPDRLFVQIDWLALPRWLLRTDLCGVIGWQADQPVGLLLAGPLREDTVWLRVAALSGAGLLAEGGGYASQLRQLWQALTIPLRDTGARRVVVLPTANWLRRGLAPLGFREVDRILGMRHVRPEAPASQSGADSHLRQATAADLDAILAIDGAAFAPLWRMNRADLEAVLDEGARITLAQTGERIVGFQISYFHDDRAHLARLGVALDSQGRGVGSVLLQAELAAYRDAEAITLNVLASSRGAQHLYTRMGFGFSGEDTPLWAFDLE